MRRLIRILEVPIYLLVIAMMSLEHGQIGVSIFLILVSMIRLWVNHMTDEIEKNKK